MKIAQKIGLDTEIFCRMCIRTKMLLSNIIGHAAELQYEKYLNQRSIEYKKAETDKHYDYIVNGFRDQVKRYETAGTNLKKVSVNLTQTHGDRSGQDGFYNKKSFDRLVISDIGLTEFNIIDIKDLPTHPKYPTHIKGRFSITRNFNRSKKFEIDFFHAMGNKNTHFPEAIEKLRSLYNFSYTQLLEQICNLNINEIDSLFSDDNFRLITGVKGFAAEEHFNIFLEQNGIEYVQDVNMYSKVDHWLGKLRVQVKFPNLRACSSTHWGVKIHKSHGSGKGELLKKDMFDILALFIGFEMDLNYSRYFPKNVVNSWLFIPMEDIDEHHEFKGYLKRVPKIEKGKYLINDISYLKSKISNY